MTEQEVDRRCAIGGTIGGIVFAAVVVGLFAAVCGTLPAPASQVDGSRESSHLLTQERAWPPGGIVATKHDEIQPVDHWQDAVLMSGAPDTFRWVWHTGAGPESCVFTADLVETDGGPMHAANAGGGRDCSPDQTVESGTNCGYFSTGWTIFAASGQSCEAYGVPLCGGIGPCH